MLREASCAELLRICPVPPSKGTPPPILWMKTAGKNQSDANDPLVSVCVQTYQHRRYIEQCLNSILRQKTDFPFEIVLGEDESRDGTREICLEYAKKYAHIIRCYLRSRKDVIYVDGMPTGRFNGLSNIRSARGRYIALCEGDDYWTDSSKLQKQVVYLEKHPEYAMCFHNRIKVDQSGKPIENSELPEEMKRPLTQEDIAMSKYPVPPTATVMYRKSCLPKCLPTWAMRMPLLDRALAILATRSGDAGYLDFIGSVYRIHSGGVLGGVHRSKDALIDLQSRKLVMNNVPMSKQARTFVIERTVRSFIRGWNATADLPAVRSIAVYFKLVRYALGFPAIFPGLIKEFRRDWKHFLIVTFKALMPAKVTGYLESIIRRKPGSGSYAVSME